MKNIIERFKTNCMLYLFLKIIAVAYNFLPTLKKYLKSTDGWMNFSVGFRTINDSVNNSIHFYNGKVKVKFNAKENLDTTLNFKKGSVIKKMLNLPPNEVLNLLLKNEMYIDGNLATMAKFNFFCSMVFEKRYKRLLNDQRKQDKLKFTYITNDTDKKAIDKPAKRKINLLRSKKCDAVEFLEDPYLSNYSIDDFPKLKNELAIILTGKPEICTERAKLFTDYFRMSDSGFFKNETSERKIASAFKYIMENRKPIITQHSLLAGTMTTKTVGILLYPETIATLIWGELNTVSDRLLNPYKISKEDINLLHSDIFPYWEKKNIREFVRKKYKQPKCQQLEERFAVYFNLKTVAISHIIPNFNKILRFGTEGIINEIESRIVSFNDNEQAEQKFFLTAMIDALGAVNTYSDNLSKQAAEDTAEEKNNKRKQELLELSKICKTVPRKPTKTLHEALQAIWVTFIALHMENTDAALSLGRLDQLLQPYFIADIAKLPTKKEKNEYVKKAIELIGNFYLKCNEHVLFSPDIGNFLFGGSPPTQAITLGGITKEGKNAVNDITYIFLKVTEILCLRDPNINARYNKKHNSDAYLKRLCEVNLITAATPVMQNDEVVMTSLIRHNYKKEHLNDWAVVGCVEPSIQGRHMGHTNAIMFNIVAALEMALHNGLHPLMDWEVGIKTGDIDSFKTFEQFFTAFETQFSFLLNQACTYNNMLAEAHSIIRPTPFLSSVIDGTIGSVKDVTKGGAEYNSSGVSFIGLADITDSLLVIKRLVFDEKQISFGDLKKALQENFKYNHILHEYILNHIPKFGSGSPDGIAMANRIVSFIDTCLKKHRNYRGGSYRTGFWSISFHVAFGCLSGALPSGRLAGKPFTPGLTPQAIASDNLLDLLQDVSKIDPDFVDNNIAFNVKINPSINETQQKTVDNIFSYVKTYFDLGGMQIQLNIVSTEIMRQAMKHPEDYRNLLVRISGYNVYFIDLQRDIQQELIDRHEYKLV